MSQVSRGNMQKYNINGLHLIIENNELYARVPFLSEHDTASPQDKLDDWARKEKAKVEPIKKRGRKKRQKAEGGGRL